MAAGPCAKLAFQEHQCHIQLPAWLDRPNRSCSTRCTLAGTADSSVDTSSSTERRACACAGTDRFVFGMVGEQDVQPPNKEKDRQERAAARQRLLEEKSAARLHRVEVLLTTLSCALLLCPFVSGRGL